jgi:hypothetical protein
MMLGFQNGRGTPQARLREGYRALNVLADRAGYRMGETYVDTDFDPPGLVLSALVRVATVTAGVTVIAVPTPADLGRSVDHQRRIHRSIETVSHVTVLIAEEHR